MGILLDVIAAPQDAAPQIVRYGAHEEARDQNRWQLVSAPVADTYNMACLWAVLEHREQPHSEGEFKVLAVRMGVQFVMLVPEALTILLADLPEDQVAEAAEKWLAMPQVRERKFHEPSFREALPALRALAQKARRDKQVLMIRTSA
jgi:hypothetical protein